MTAALWVSDPQPSSGEWCESDEWCIDNIAPKDIAEAVADCADFQAANASDLAQAGNDEQNGHDFFLTRNGHGAGFWDRGYGEVGERLTEAAHVYGTHEVDAPDEGEDYPEGPITFHG